MSQDHVIAARLARDTKARIERHEAELANYAAAGTDTFFGETSMNDVAVEEIERQLKRDRELLSNYRAILAK